MEELEMLINGWGGAQSLPENLHELGGVEYAPGQKVAWNVGSVRMLVAEKKRKCYCSSEHYSQPVTKGGYVAPPFHNY